MLLRTLCAVTTALTAAFTILTATGCSSADTSSVVSQSESSAEQKTDITAESVLSQIDNELLDGKAYWGDDTFESNCKKLYGVDTDQLTDGGIIYASDGGSADEVSMIKTSDSELGKKLLTERLKSRRTTFETYKPEEMTKLDEADIFEASGYWVLVISDDEDSISKLIKSAAE